MIKHVTRTFGEKQHIRDIPSTSLLTAMFSPSSLYLPTLGGQANGAGSTGSGRSLSDGALPVSAGVRLLQNWSEHV